MTQKTSIESAYEILNRAVVQYRGRSVATVAAVDPALAAENYEECFVRDFVPSALVFLMDGEPAIVRNFLRALQQLSGQQKVMEGHERAFGLMPASFKVATDGHGQDRIIADFGERAIGRVAPVDSAMWWLILLRVYIKTTGDIALAHRPEFQEGIRETLRLYLQESFETSPAMLVPDASFMIDRRLGVYGHPLEIQSLFYGMLNAVQEFLLPNSDNRALMKMAKKRMQTLRSYVRIFYWLDKQRLNEIHRFRSEEFGLDAVNLLNIYPESIPEWIDGWIPDECGYLVGNLGPSRMDFRIFSLGNFLAILFGLATDEQGQQIMNLYEQHWEELVGEMPLKICYPATVGQEWEFSTGSDPKNAAWSYHNGGNWPTLLWAFVAAALKTGRTDLAERAVEVATQRLPADRWPEYYDGRKGSLIGRRANLCQTWSATALIVAHHFMENPDSRDVLNALVF